MYSKSACTKGLAVFVVTQG